MCGLLDYIDMAFLFVLIKQISFYLQTHKFKAFTFPKVLTNSVDKVFSPSSLNLGHSNTPSDFDPFKGDVI